MARIATFHKILLGFAQPLKTYWVLRLHKGWGYALQAHVLSSATQNCCLSAVTNSDHSTFLMLFCFNSQMAILGTVHLGEHIIGVPSCVRGIRELERCQCAEGRLLRHNSISAGFFNEEMQQWEKAFLLDFSPWFSSKGSDAPLCAFRNWEQTLSHETLQRSKGWFPLCHHIISSFPPNSYCHISQKSNS